MPKCMARTCSYYSGRKDIVVKMHTFPRDKEIIKMWLTKSGYPNNKIGTLTEEILKDGRGNRFRLCARHFLPEDYTLCRQSLVLKDYVVPTVFKEDSADGSGPKKKRCRNRRNLNDPSLLCISTCKLCGCTCKYRKFSDVSTQTDDLQNEEVRDTPVIVIREAPQKIVTAPIQSTNMDHSYCDADTNMDLSVVNFFPDSEAMEEYSTNERHVKERKFIVFETAINQLLMGQSCPRCFCFSKIVAFKKHVIGTQLIVHSTCEEGHYEKIWESQPNVKDLAVGNVLLGAAILAASCTDHMTTSLRMDEDQSHMTERIFNLTLDIICLLTGESFPPVKFGDHVTITVPPPHSVISGRPNKQKVLEILRKMMELLTEEEWQYIEEHRDLYKDTVMENQPPLTSPDGSSNSKPPERCTGPLYSQDCPKEDNIIPHHYQGVKLIPGSAVVKEEVEETYVRSDQQSMEGDMMKTIKQEVEETYVRNDPQTIVDGDMVRTIKQEEEETYVRSDQQSVEEGDMMRTIKQEEEEMYVRSDQQSMEEGDMMRTIKQEEEETYVRSDQQSMEEGNMMRTIKQEEETYVRSDQQSMEEGGMMRTSKEEEEETYVRSDQQSMEEGNMMRTIKQEEETYVSDQQSMEEGGMMRTIKQEEETYVSDQQSMEEGGMMRTIKQEEETYVSDQQSMEEGGMMRTIKEEDTFTENKTMRSPGIRNLSETRLSVFTDCTTDDDDVTGQESPADILVTPNISQDSPHLSHPEGPHTQNRSLPAGRHSCSTCGKCFVQKTNLVRHERIHTDYFHERSHTGVGNVRSMGNVLERKEASSNMRSHTGEERSPIQALIKQSGTSSKNSPVVHRW
ncbi:oocyte zinc finger protein XlCOF29-like isoform X3 [Hyperolius riggenbachi]|uniref:oocyte zinc finger protein XlCOF29-like isoform X3 n=1 Tax=Hyperolius riggenbachi TaxID=752182 RepID=UPI0035A3A525